MARLVRYEGRGPCRIEPGGKAVFACMCGLSQNLPYCDGSHKKVAAEQGGKLYVYDGARREVLEVREEEPGDASPGA